MQKLIILRGAPASGKTTIAKSLRNFNKKIVWLKVDNFKDFFGEDSPGALDSANSTAIAALSYLLDKGYSVVMEGIFQNPNYVLESTEIAKTRNIPFKIFELECSLEELLRRDKNREGVKEGCRKPLGDAVISKIYHILNENPVENAHKLDTEKLSIEEAIGLLKQELTI